MNNFDYWEQHTDEDSNINSLILSQASDISEKLTSLECALHCIPEFNHTMEGDVEVETYTEDAQDIFNIHYDKQVEELYSLLNNQLKIIEV